MRERIKEVMSKIFSIPINEIPDDASVNSLSKWDSLGQIELMLALEMEFNVRLSSDDMLKLLSLEAIASYLQDQEMSYNDAKSCL
jgi:acyl carrier protein